ncbi:iron-hydroxamate ABC transporter substrate-binding protein [Metabacillus sp. GX 13764]|uniref:iron-hydroxamate ABC transporter substrate-binding protein n=1 Tax=Metabacillus kandeliae TaxID=2900151 RepID=UPI001E526C19|nr:iron-hydroxamate ABC transporter substrate-binding protein [Metabacillus kandeliae]MCD7034357.1 iron-hydroxamate ABC transporter substrate-binding protein [Metabacillus kandeliae]
MKKLFLPVLIGILLLISGCSSQSSEKKESSDKTITYQSENGPVKVPANPKRVVVLASLAGNVMALNVPIVGIDAWSKDNPKFQDKLKDAKVVTDEDLEKIIDLNPDLIIGLSNTKNIDKLKKIAPTVTYTYGKADYLTQHIEIGKLLNKEKEAADWVNDFKKRAEADGKEIQAKIGDNATISVVESFDKQLYVFGNNWGRGTEVLYQAMKLPMPKNVEEKALKPGYYTISPEVLPDYAGDYLVLSKNADSDTSFEETNTYKNIPAVKNKHVIEVNSKEFYFNDPITLDYQLETLKKGLLGN